jgi:hypothetical protein
MHSKETVRVSVYTCHWVIGLQRTHVGATYHAWFIVQNSITTTINADDLDATPAWRSLATREDQMVELCGSGTMKSW